MLINLVAAHIVSFKATWRRTGIWMIHSGIVLMMMGELITGLFAVESQMSFSIGESASYVEQPSAPELAVVDSSDLKKDRVTVIPTARLKRGGTVLPTRSSPSTWKWSNTW